MARIIYPLLKAFNTDLQPLSGGLAYTYAPGGTTHQTTYADPALKTKNKNPVVLDPAGEAPIFFSKGAEVKVVVKNAAGGSIWTSEVSNRPMDAPPTADMATFQAYNHKGAALSGGKVYTYKAGTTTPDTTYSDAALLVENDNPIVLDANGQADIFRAKGFEGLKLILKDSVDRLLWSWQYFGFSELYAANKQSLNLQLFTPYLGELYAANKQSLNLQLFTPVVFQPLTLIDTDYQGGDYRGVWGDGTFHYAAASTGGLISYSVDGSGNLTFIDQELTFATDVKVWGDGTWLYTAAGANGIKVYSVDGAGNLTYKSRAKSNYTSDNNLWGRAPYIYTTASGSSGGVRIWSVDVSGIVSFVRRIYSGGDAPNGIWSDGTYLYTVAGSTGLRSFSFSGDNIVLIDTDFQESGAYSDVWGDENLLYVTRPQGLMTYSRDGAGNLTFIEAIAGIGNSTCVWGDGTFIYVGNTSNGIGFQVFQVDDSGHITLIDSWPGVTLYDIWADPDDDFIYTAHTANGIFSWDM